MNFGVSHVTPAGSGRSLFLSWCLGDHSSTRKLEVFLPNVSKTTTQGDPSSPLPSQSQGISMSQPRKPTEQVTRRE